MPTKPLHDAEIRKTWALYERYRSSKKVADELGLHESTVRHRLRTMPRPDEPEILTPILPDGEPPIEELIDHLTRNSDRRFLAAEARRWIQVPVRAHGPIGIAWIGDPHVDDNGCAWALLREHVDIIKNTPGLYAVGLGDYNNNWVGRLGRLWANQDTSAKTAWRLVEWLLRELESKLILLIKGNHNLWSGAGDPLDYLKAPGVITEDWRARIEFQLPEAEPFRAVAAHDFPGNSMWNPLHANQKKAKFGGEADLYIAGHRHEWALAHHEDGDRGRCYWLARARGYKFLDDYAEINGYHQQKYGASIVSVIDPGAEGVTRVQCFSDLARGADYLTYLRSRGP